MTKKKEGRPIVHFVAGVVAEGLCLEASHVHGTHGVLEDEPVKTCEICDGRFLIKEQLQTE